jgi:hypothetical protein
MLGDDRRRCDAKAKQLADDIGDYAHLQGIALTAQIDPPFCESGLDCVLFEQSDALFSQIRKPVRTDNVI